MSKKEGLIKNAITSDKTDFFEATQLYFKALKSRFEISFYTIRNLVLVKSYTSLRLVVQYYRFTYIIFWKGKYNFIITLVYGIMDEDKWNSHYAE